MSTDKHVTLSQAAEGMLVYKRASGRSPSTIADYRVHLKRLLVTAQPTNAG
jgi:hypothetical protein